MSYDLLQQRLDAARAEGSPVALYGDDLDAFPGVVTAVDAEWVELRCADGEHAIIRLSGLYRVSREGDVPFHWETKRQLHEIDGGRLASASRREEIQRLQAVLEGVENGQGKPAISDPDGFLAEMRVRSELAEDWE